MNGSLIAVFSVVGLILGVGGWLGWQLLRQNGRMLLRLDELEKRLDELEFGEPDDALQDESQGRARHSVRADGEEANNGAQGSDAPHPEDRASRFDNRSLTRSKIKRDGLKAGTPAPDFRLPCLDGSERSLQDFRGRPVLLVLSDPHCGPCNGLMPHLAKFHREHSEIQLVMISRGDPKENRAKVKEHGVAFPVMLQQRWEISRLYAMFATPISYLIDEAGVIAHDVVVGVEPILALMAKAKVGNAEASP